MTFLVKSPDASVDPAKITKAAGRARGDGFRWSSQNLPDLFNQLRGAYVKLTTRSPRVMDPTVEQLFEANKIRIATALGNCLGEVQLYGGTKCPMSITNSEDSYLWVHLVAMFADPAKFGNAQYPPVEIYPAGKDHGQKPAA